MLFQGILLGLTLSFMIGPLLFAIVEAGLERGFRAGMAVAIGIWASDVLYVTLVQCGLEFLTALTTSPHFKLWAGLLGGCLLMSFGAGSFFKKSTAGMHPQRFKVQDSDIGHPSSKPELLRYGLRGFLLNTINPFTVLFWVGIASGVVAPGGWSGMEILRFFGAMLGTLALADTLKAYAAKRLGDWLTPSHIFWAQRGIGILLMIFGLVMVARVL